MDIEFKDPSRRGRTVIVVGLVMAVLAGVLAFYFLDRTRQQVQNSGVQHASIVVATHDIAARTPIGPGDVVLADVPLDPATANGVFYDTQAVQGLITGVPILSGQPVYANFLAGQTQGAQFAILEPGASIDPNGPSWRAVSLTVPDDRAVGGMIETGQTVDVIVTAEIELPDDLIAKGRYYSDRSSQLVYQDMPVLAKSGTTYIIKATLDIAEELSHLQASGASSFTLLLRPEQDDRLVDATTLGTTTNALISKYGFPIPEVFPPGSGSFVRPSPTPTPVASPEPTPSGPVASDIPTSPTPTPISDQP